MHHATLYTLEVCHLRTSSTKRLSMTDAFAKLGDLDTEKRQVINSSDKESTAMLLLATTAIESTVHNYGGGGTHTLGVKPSLDISLS